MMKKCLLLMSAMLMFSAITSCDNITSKIIKKGTVKTGSEVASKVAKEITEEGVSKFSKRAISLTLKEIATSNKVLNTLYNAFATNISKEFADDIIVKTTKNGMELVSKTFPNSAIRISDNIITCKGGSLINSGPVNEFLNHLLPNKTYMIDGAFIYKTDDLGRVISCSADRSKAFNTISRNTQRNSDVQKLVIENLDGKAGLDDAGHLFANATGGLNELINQVPMSRELNRNGIWRKFESIEEEALKQGKKVVSKRNLLYRGSEKRPYAIEFIYIIDGVEYKEVIKNL